jgi:hypothetical protein
VIPGGWLYPQTEISKLGERRYMFFSDDKSITLPKTNLIFTLFRILGKENEQGYIYPGCVLEGFGEYFFFPSPAVEIKSFYFRQ